MISAKCPHCGAVGAIYTGTCFWCPRCRKTHTQGWSQRQHPASAQGAPSSSALDRGLPQRGSAQLNQRVRACPECHEPVRPWAIVCVRCGYVLEETRVT
jgi:hypothetical protein